MITPIKRLIWVAVDLDGTLAGAIWTPENPTTAIGDPIPENIAKLRDIVADGEKIIIHTARGWEHYLGIEEWLIANEVPFNLIQCGKLLAARYIDDRAVPADAESWRAR